MSDGYITSKQLSGNKGLTEVARAEAEREDREFDEAVVQMAMQIVKEEKERKKRSKRKKEREEKSAVK